MLWVMELGVSWPLPTCTAAHNKAPSLHIASKASPGLCRSDDRPECTTAPGAEGHVAEAEQSPCAIASVDELLGQRLEGAPNSRAAREHLTLREMLLRADIECHSNPQHDQKAASCKQIPSIAPRI